MEVRAMGSEGACERWWRMVGHRGIWKPPTTTHMRSPAEHTAHRPSPLHLVEQTEGEGGAAVGGSYGPPLLGMAMGCGRFCLPPRRFPAILPLWPAIKAKLRQRRLRRARSQSIHQRRNRMQGPEITMEQPNSTNETAVLREYEAAHKVWKNTSVFTPEGQRAKLALDEARQRYLAAVRAAHPTWIVC